MKLVFLILFVSVKLFACASVLELSGAVVNSRAQNQLIDDLEGLVEELEGWDRFLNGELDPKDENLFLISVGQEVSTRLEERKQYFRQWLLARQANVVYEGNFKIADYLGHFDVYNMFDSETRLARIEALKALLVIQNFNSVLERELAQKIGEGQVFRRVVHPNLLWVIGHVNLRVDLLGDEPVEKLLRYAEENADKPAAAIIKRYRLLVTVFGVGHLASVLDQIEAILAQKGIHFRPAQIKFRRFFF